MSDPGAIAGDVIAYARGRAPADELSVVMALIADGAVCEVHKASGNEIATDVAFAVLRGQQKRGNVAIIRSGSKR